MSVFGPLFGLMVITVFFVLATRGVRYAKLRSRMRIAREYRQPSREAGPYSHLRITSWKRRRPRYYYHRM